MASDSGLGMNMPFSEKDMNRMAAAAKVASEAFASPAIQDAIRRSSARLGMANSALDGLLDALRPQMEENASRMREIVGTFAGGPALDDAMEAMRQIAGPLRDMQPRLGISGSVRLFNAGLSTLGPDWGHLALPTPSGLVSDVADGVVEYESLDPEDQEAAVAEVDEIDRRLFAFLMVVSMIVATIGEIEHWEYSWIFWAIASADSLRGSLRQAFPDRPQDVDE